jgi:flagellar hook assembly protein FlgD
MASVENPSTHIPTRFSLEQNYPNPFNPSTTIQFALPKPARVWLVVYDLLGRQVMTLIDQGEYQAGFLRRAWDGKNSMGQPISSGLYFYKFVAVPLDRSNPFIQTKKMILLK